MFVPVAQFKLTVRFQTQLSFPSQIIPIYHLPSVSSTDKNYRTASNGPQQLPVTALVFQMYPHQTQILL
jgi:hypothetical protein